MSRCRYAARRRARPRGSDVHGLEDGSEAYIDVVRSWDDMEGEIAPKSAAGTRRIPLPETLRRLLADHIGRAERSGDDFVFGASGHSPVSPSYVRATDRAWNLAGISRVTLHECRHGYASFLDAVGVSKARADRDLGHAGTTVSDRYRHRLRGHLATDATLLDEYLVGSGGTVIYLAATDSAPRRSRVSA